MTEGTFRMHVTSVLQSVAAVSYVTGVATARQHSSVGHDKHLWGFSYDHRSKNGPLA